MSTTGRIPRKIRITVSDMDAFSDDVKVGGLIDEIESAEKKARAAKLDRQIKASQPSRMSLKASKISYKIKQGVADFREGLAVLMTKLPKDPKVEKLKIKVKAPKNMATSKVKVKIPKSEKAPRVSILAKINSLVPGGISYKTLGVSCLVAIAVVTATELSIWAFTHPTVKTEVPKTGFIIEDDEEEMVYKNNTTEVMPGETTTSEQTNAQTSTPTATRRTTTTKRTTTTTSRTTSSGATYIDSNLADGEMVEEVADPDRKPKDTIIYYEPEEEKQDEDKSDDKSEEPAAETEE